MIIGNQITIFRDEKARARCQEKSVPFFLVVNYLPKTKPRLVKMFIRLVKIRFKMFDHYS